MNVSWLKSAMFLWVFLWVSHGFPTLKGLTKRSFQVVAPVPGQSLDWKAAAAGFFG